MQVKFTDKHIFGINVCFAAVAIVLLTATLVAAEIYATDNHVLAEVEIANGAQAK